MNLKSGKYHFRIRHASVLLEELVRQAKIALILGRQRHGQKTMTVTLELKPTVEACAI
jgi:hypothetical protein